MSAVLPNATFGNVPEVDLNDARPRRWGWMLLALGLGSFLAWAFAAPLDAAITSSGTVVVSGNRKLVQPLTGGKVLDILARDGDQVDQGQVLLRLDSTQSRAQLDIVRGQWLVAMATQARLQAEQRGSAQVDFPPVLLTLGSDSRVTEVMELQSRLLDSRRLTRSSEMQSMEAGLRGLEYQVQGHMASRVAKQTQERMLSEELRGQRTLAAEGYYPRNRVSEQERLYAGLQGAAAEDSSSIGRTQQAISETRARMASRQQEFRKDIESQLSEAQRDALGFESRMRALEFDVNNTEVRAPVSGTVIGSILHTVGGVVAAGTPVMEIVPKDALLRVESQLPVQMVDKVSTGLPVHVLFSALNQATTPRIEGRIVQISADALADSRQNGSYFKVVVEVTPEGMTQLQHHAIKAGMPADVFIKTGERTFMSYVFKPLMDRMGKALIEP
jgi:membrane fusion protein, protease secretion system